jgi:hypothetical protein
MQFGMRYLILIALKVRSKSESPPRGKGCQGLGRLSFEWTGLTCCRASGLRESQEYSLEPIFYN